MSADMGDSVVAVVGSLLIAIALLAVVLGAVVAVVGGNVNTGTGNFTENVILGASNSGTITAENPNVTNVRQSLGTGVNLTGGGYTATGVAGLDPPYTVTVYANSTTNSTDQTAFTIDSGNVLTLSYNATADEYRAYWFNESSRESALATVAAADVTTPTVLAVRHNGSAINVSANGTTGADVTPALDGGAAQNASGWLGRQDELRILNGTLNSSQLTTLRTTPTAPLPSVETRSRVMFDARGNVSEVPVYFSGGTVDLGAGQLVDTVAGEPTDTGDFQVSGDTLTATDNGTLDGNPVAFINGTATTATGPVVGLISTLTSLGTTALSLLVVGVLVIAASKLLNVFGGGF